MKILQVVHALPPHTFGGTELYTANLASALADRHEVAVAAPNGSETADDVAMFSLPTTRPNRVERATTEPAAVTDPAVERRFEAVVDEFDPDLVHFQHFKELSARLPVICRNRGVACVATLHDFWTLCHREQLFQPDGTRCSGPESVAKCTDCYLDAVTAEAAERLGETAAKGAGALRPLVEPAVADRVARRDDLLRDALAATDRLISPSKFLRATFVAYGVPADRVVHRRNGIVAERFADAGFDPERPIRFGYVGRITPVKGVDLLLRAFREVPGDAELHVYGAFDPADDYHARLESLADERVQFHGWFADPAAPYEELDVLVVPSVWYENSPLVIQEANAARVPVVTADVGGMAELVTHGEDGLTFSVGDYRSLGAQLRQLVDSPSLVANLRRGIDPPTTMAAHARELERLYADCVREPGAAASLDSSAE